MSDTDCLSTDRITLLATEYWRLPAHKLAANAAAQFHEGNVACGACWWIAWHVNNYTTD